MKFEAEAEKAKIEAEKESERMKAQIPSVAILGAFLGPL